MPDALIGPPFPEPLIHVSAERPGAEEDAPLLKAVELVTSEPSLDRQLVTLEAFCREHPSSPWAPSVRAQLAKRYLDRGRLSLALESFEEAWGSVRNLDTPGAKKVRDFILAHWATLLVGLGDAERLTELFTEVSGRTLDRGHLQQMLNAAQEAHGRMTAEPRSSFRCGITALHSVGLILDPRNTQLHNLEAALAGPTGLTMAELVSLGEAHGVALRGVELIEPADLVVPSVIHYRLGHFAAVTARAGNRYLVVDPVFAAPQWFRHQDILAESDGRCLVAAGILPEGYRPLQGSDLQDTWGRGYPNTIPDIDDQFMPVVDTVGLPGWRVSEPFINLWLHAAVVRYPTATGRNVALDLSFKQRNTRSTSGAFGFGAGWECSWLTYVNYISEYDGESRRWIQLFQKLYLPRGGIRVYTTDGATPEYYSNSTMDLWENPDGPNAKWIVTYPDTSSFEYDYHQDLGLGYRRAYLRRFTDAAGRVTTWSYTTSDGVVRLSFLEDVDGLRTYFNYDGTFSSQVSRVVDPYSRTNVFQYGVDGTLTNIVNPEDIGASLAYDDQGIVTNLSTPYGATGFQYSVNTNTGNVVARALTVTLPTAARHLYIYRDQSTALNPVQTNVNLMPFSYSSSEVPDTGALTNTFDNTWMDARNSYHWAPRQYANLSSGFQASGDFNNLTTNDYRLATLKHWLRSSTTNLQGTLSATLSMTREPSPDGVTEGLKQWYDYWGKYPVVGTNYAGQTVTNWFSRGSHPKPRFIAIRLPSGTTRFTYSAYNGKRFLSENISTYSSGTGVGLRTNRLEYATTGSGHLIDVIRVYGPTGDLVSSNAWNTKHQLLTNISALGEATAYTYTPDALSQVSSIRYPNGLTLTNCYYTSGPIGFLEKSVFLSLGITNSFTYTNGLVHTHTNERGLVTTNHYDRLQRVIRLSDASGSATWGYSNLSLVFTTDRLGQTNRFTYDQFGRIAATINPLDLPTSSSYFDWGALQAITNALGEVSQFQYDNLERLTVTLDPTGHGTTNTYDMLGQLIVVSDPAGQRVTNTFNNQGLLTTVSNAIGQLSGIQYDILDRPINTVDTAGLGIVTTYDALGRIRSQTSSDGGSVSRGYTLNTAGPTSHTNQLGKVTRIQYDLAGRITAETNANLEVLRWEYGRSGELLSLTDGNNHTTTWGYDWHGRMTSKTNAAGVRVIKLDYDANGLVTNRWTPAKGNVALRYDAVGNLTNINYAVSPDVQMQYDGLNRVTNRLDATGVTVYEYTPTGQLLYEDGPWAEDTVIYSHAINDTVTGMSALRPNASAWEQSFDYDTANRLTNIVSPAGAFGYAHHPGLNGVTASSSLIRRVALPNGASITNTFDNVGRLLSTRLLNASGTVLGSHSYAFDAAGQPTNQVRVDGSSVEYRYDSIGQLISAKAKEPGGVDRLHEQFGYGYDTAWNLNYRTNRALSQTFNTDAQNQLTTATRSGTLTVAGSTAAAASSVTVNGVGAALYGDSTFAKDGFSIVSGTNTFTAVAQDTMGRSSTHSVSAFLPATVAFQYDANGNLLSDGALGYDYDDANQLICITATNSWRSQFVYDASGRRRTRTELIWQGEDWTTNGIVRYVYAGGLVIQERDGNNIPTVAYTRGLDLSGSFDGVGGIGGLLARSDLGGGTHAWYHADGQGNVTTMLSPNLGIAARYLYDPFGTLLALSGPVAEANLYRFSSKEAHPRSGLSYFSFRYYSPALQRWLNADPAGETGGLNLHTFAENRASHVVDPFGLAPSYLPKSGHPFCDWVWENHIGRKSFVYYGDTPTQSYARRSDGGLVHVPDVIAVPLKLLGEVIQAPFRFVEYVLYHPFGRNGGQAWGNVGEAIDAVEHHLKEAQDASGLDWQINDNKMGHAFRSADYQSLFGVLATPFITLYGVYYEISHLFKPGGLNAEQQTKVKRSDFKFYGLFDSQHPASWAYDSPGDLLANLIGQLNGMLYSDFGSPNHSVLMIPGPNYDQIRFNEWRRTASNPGNIFLFWETLGPPGLNIRGALSPWTKSGE